MSELQIVQNATTPAVPPVGYLSLYAKTDGKWHAQTPAGIEVELDSKQNNLAAVVAPIATDDINLGYVVGSVWIDINTDIIYTCVDSTIGSAIWSSSAAFSDHLVLSNIGANTHAQIDSHIGDVTNNPHAVTLEQSLATGDMAAITATIIKNAVDYVIYDTANDSDGGAWRHRTTHTSWYNEALNTATRGATREFPAKALLVATLTDVTIYDLTVPGVPMWMVFTGGGAGNSGVISWAAGGALSALSLAALNGYIVIGTSSNSVIVKLGSDSYDYTSTTGIGSSSNVIISDRNGPTDIIGTGYTVVSPVINDVAITVLDDAPIDSVTGLPIPTIAVMTVGDTSIIHPDGNVNNHTNPWPGSSGSELGKFDANGNLWTKEHLTVTGGSAGWLFHSKSSLTQTLSISNALLIEYSNSSVPTTLGGTATGLRPFTHGTIALAVSLGLTLLRNNPATPASSIVAYITDVYSTGWMVGDIRRAYLANSKTIDRSAKGGTLVANGTVTETVNTNGVNTYSFPTNADFFSEAHSVDFDYGTGDFMYQVWVIPNTVPTTVSKRIFELAEITYANYMIHAIDTVLHNVIQITGSSLITGKHTYANGVPCLVTMVRSAGTLILYENGQAVGTTASSGNITNALNSIILGKRLTGVHTALGYDIALMRLSATASTAEQIKYMYETEKQLFVTGAVALLSAAAITDLSYNAKAEMLGVETAAAYDYMHGLEVVHRGIAKTDTTDLGFSRVQQNGTTDVRVSLPANSLRSQLNDKSEALAKAKNSTRNYSFTSIGATWDLPKGWKADGTLFNVTDGTFTGVTQAFDGFIWQLTGLTTGKVHNIRIRRS